MKKTSIISLLYHEVTNNPEDSGFQRKNALPYKHSVDEFRSHLSELNKFNKYVTTINNIHRGRKNILLTFDDGGISNLRIADMLEEYNFKGHFFISTDFIGKPYFLNEDHLKDLFRRGHIIGSHSQSHPNVFKSLTALKMKEEWNNSRNILSSILKTDIDCCSIPGGDSSQLCYKTASSSGYKFIFNSEPKVTIEENRELIVLGRISFKKDEPILKLKNTLQLKGLKKLLIIRKIKVLIKTIFFSNLFKST